MTAKKGVYFKVRKHSQRQSGVHVRERTLYLYLLRVTHEQQRRAGMCSTSETRSSSRWAYEGEVEQWADEVVERTGGDDWIA